LIVDGVGREQHLAPLYRHAASLQRGRQIVADRLRDDAGASAGQPDYAAILRDDRVEVAANTSGSGASVSVKVPS
jgi:hypothetical protein